MLFLVSLESVFQGYGSANRQGAREQFNRVVVIRHRKSGAIETSIPTLLSPYGAEDALSPSVVHEHFTFRIVFEATHEPFVIFAIVIWGEGICDEQATLNLSLIHI